MGIQSPGNIKAEYFKKNVLRVCISLVAFHRPTLVLLIDAVPPVHHHLRKFTQIHRVSWCYPLFISSVVLFSAPLSLPSISLFPMSHFCEVSALEFQLYTTPSKEVLLRMDWLNSCSPGLQESFFHHCQFKASIFDASLLHSQLTSHDHWKTISWLYRSKVMPSPALLCLFA